MRQRRLGLPLPLGPRLLDREWWVKAPRYALITIVVLCLILGTWGMVLYSRTEGFRQNWNTGVIDMVYYILQLFLGQSGPTGGEAGMPPIPWQLNLARLLAPASAVIGAVMAILALFDDQVKLAVSRSKRGHVVLVGDTPTAAVIEDALRQENATVVRADSGSLDDLTNAGARGAAAVYICNDDTGDPGANLRVAATVQSLTPTTKNRMVAVAMNDPDLAPAMLARHLTNPDTAVDLFSLINTAATSLASYTMRLPNVHRIWLLGAGPLRDEVIFELAAEWAIRHSPHDALAIVVSGPGAAAAIERAQARMPAALREQVNFTGVDDVAELGEVSAAEKPDAVVICGRDDTEALSLALSNPEAWGGGPGSLIVHVTHGDQATALFGRQGIGVLDDIDGVLDVVTTASLIERADRGILVHEPVLDRIAHCARRTSTRHSHNSDNGAGDVCLLPWAQLGDSSQEQHKEQVADLMPLITYLNAAQWRVVPFGASIGLEMPDEAVQKLAENYVKHTNTTNPVAYHKQQIQQLPETLSQLGLGLAQVSNTGAIFPHPVILRQGTSVPRIAEPLKG